MDVKIAGMSCQHCVKAIESALKGLRGLKNIKVEIGKASFEIPAGLNKDVIKKAIEDAGYEADEIFE
jgi:copper chaperone CopZ